MVARVLLIFVGCVVAILSAGVLLALAIWGWMVASAGLARLDLVLLRYLVIFAVPLTGLLATVPLLVGVAYGEAAGKRTPGYYAVAGAASGLVALGLHFVLAFARNASARRLVEDAGTAEGALRLGAVILMCAMVGLVAGMVYWALVGRRPRRVRD